MKRSLIQLDHGLSRLTMLWSDNAVIGRDSVCDVVVHDERVSRQHVRIAMSKYTTSVLDLSSRNGLYVNGFKVKVGQLLHLDVIRIGNTRFRFFETAPVGPDSALALMHST
ncbi:MAG: FHA domain-containing protein [Variovorax sp.]|nr:FHA domain-containing protein [Variovorax sp.]